MAVLNNQMVIPNLMVLGHVHRLLHRVCKADGMAHRAGLGLGAVGHGGDGWDRWKIILITMLRKIPTLTCFLICDGYIYRYVKFLQSSHKNLTSTQPYSLTFAIARFMSHIIRNIFCNVL